MAQCDFVYFACERDTGSRERTCPLPETKMKIAISRVDVIGVKVTQPGGILMHHRQILM